MLLTYAFNRSIVNEAAEASSVKPMVNMGQGFFGYNRMEPSNKLRRDICLYTAHRSS